MYDNEKPRDFKLDTLPKTNMDWLMYKFKILIRDLPPTKFYLIHCVSYIIKLCYEAWCHT